MKKLSCVSTRAMLVLVALASACGDKKNDTQAGNEQAAGSGSAGSGSAGTGASADELNLDCPEHVGPFEGEYAQKGKCCYRTANSDRLAKVADSQTTKLEYRLNFVNTSNHPLSLGLDVIKNLNVIRVEAEQQSLLWRFEGPSQGGKLASGAGKLTVGVGRYNCDGTYSFYSDTAAPSRPEAGDDASRWKIHETPITIDTSKQGVERFKPVWAGNSNRSYTVTPFLNTATYVLDWELWDQGFELEKLPTDDDALDCIGQRTSSRLWETNGSFRVYAQLEKNDKDPISALAEQTMCQLLAFGVVVNKDDPKNSCSKAERCKPGSADCAWVKLPDSLCPTTPDEMSKWGCHVADANNADKEKTHCTAEAPTGVLDPDKGAMSQGQCCDPTGKHTGNLPTCNAYMLRNEFVAAAVKITDDKKDALQTNCTTFQ